MTASGQSLGGALCQRVDAHLVDLMPGPEDATRGGSKDLGQAAPTQGELAELRSHIAHCSRCGPLMAEMAALADATAGLQEIDPPDMVSAKILAASRQAVAAKQRAKQRWSRAVYVAAPCLAAAAALLFWMRAKNETYLPQPVPVQGETSAPETAERRKANANAQGSEGESGKREVARQDHLGARDRRFAEPPPAEDVLAERSQPAVESNSTPGRGRPSKEDARASERSASERSASERSASEGSPSKAKKALSAAVPKGGRLDDGSRDLDDEAIGGGFAAPPPSTPSAPAAVSPGQSAQHKGSDSPSKTASSVPVKEEVRARAPQPPADTADKADRAPMRNQPEAKRSAAPTEGFAPATPSAIGTGAASPSAGPRAPGAERTATTAQAPADHELEAAKPAPTSALRRTRTFRDEVDASKAAFSSGAGNLGGAGGVGGLAATGATADAKNRSTISVDEQGSLFKRLQAADVTCQEIFSAVGKLEQSTFAKREPLKMATAYEVRARCQPTDSAKAADRAAAQKLRSHKPTTP